MNVETARLHSNNDGTAVALLTLEQGNGNIENAIDSELAFYGRVFDIDVPGALKLNIDNLP